jgi:hypothetical protein
MLGLWNCTHACNHTSKNALPIVLHASQLHAYHPKLHVLLYTGPRQLLFQPQRIQRHIRRCCICNGVCAAAEALLACCPPEAEHPCATAANADAGACCQPAERPATAPATGAPTRPESQHCSGEASGMTMPMHRLHPCLIVYTQSCMPWACT